MWDGESIRNIRRMELACLTYLDELKALLKTVHLLFHDLQFDIESLMKLHERIDMSRKSINTIFHSREFLVHLFSDIANIKLDNLKSTLYRLKSLVYLLKSPVYLLKSLVYLLKSRIYLPKSYVRLSKPRSNELFERRKLLINSPRLLRVFLYRHCPI